MSLNHDLLINEISRSSKQLTEKLSHITDNDWEKPSHCHMWAIKDLVSHIIAVDGFFINTLTRSLAGDFLPPEGMPNPGTATAESMSGGISSRAIQISETSLKTPGQLLAVLSDFETQTLELLRNIKETQWNNPAYHPMNTLTVELILGLKHMESVIHNWDIWHSIDDNYVMNEESCLLICKLWQTSLITDWFFTPDENQLDPVAISIELGSEANFNLLIWNGALSFNANSDITKQRHPTYISMSPYRFVLLMTARTTIDSLITANEIKIEDNLNILNKFHTWFRGT